jgi:hypothetical protein
MHGCAAGTTYARGVTVPFMLNIYLEGNTFNFLVFDLHGIYGPLRNGKDDIEATLNS